MRPFRLSSTCFLITFALAGVVVASDAAYHFALAKLLTEEGAYREALEHFSQAVDESPEDVFIRIEYAKLLLRLDRAKAGEVHASEALALAPENLDAMRIYSQVQLALVQEEEGALERARDTLERIRVLAPDDGQSMMSLGQIYLGESRFDEAAEVFKELLSHRPGNRAVYSFLLDALLRAGELVEAEEVLSDILEVDPGFEKARVTLAELQSERGDHEAAIKTLKSAPGEFDDTEVQRRLALELFRTGDLDGALVALDKALASQQEDFGILYLKALVLASKGRNTEAAELARRLLAMRPESPEISSLLARVLERQGKFDEAAAALAAMAELLIESGEEADALQIQLEQARLLSRGERWQAVLELTESLVPVDEDAGGDEFVFLRADALFHLGREEDALALLRRGNSDPEMVDRVLAKEAEILLRLDREEEALERVGELTSAGEVEDLLLAAEVYQRLERYAGSIPILERAKATSDGPARIQVLFWLGAAYERTGRNSEAEAVFQELLDVEPEFAPALNYLGYMWAEEGQNLDRALVMVSQAVNLEPDNGAYADSLGWTHFQLGNYEEARGHLERAADLVGDDPVVFEHLGDLYVVLGDLEKAREVYERALALEADNTEQVRRKLEELAGKL
ncbi:MAG: tetratricopeptide repeat protein [Acidobacteria bacterium]|nr:MAG: tetratricopeptide repeat protein [Acidobacteriota bacterium]